jgi:hypothetical protein
MIGATGTYLAGMLSAVASAFCPRTAPPGVYGFQHFHLLARLRGWARICPITHRDDACAAENICSVRWRGARWKPVIVPETVGPPPDLTALTTLSIGSTGEGYAGPRLRKNSDVVLKLAHLSKSAEVAAPTGDF